MPAIRNSCHEKILRFSDGQSLKQLGESSANVLVPVDAGTTLEERVQWIYKFRNVTRSTYMQPNGRFHMKYDGPEKKPRKVPEYDCSLCNTTSQGDNRSLKRHEHTKVHLENLCSRLSIDHASLKAYKVCSICGKELSSNRKDAYDRHVAMCEKRSKVVEDEALAEATVIERESSVSDSPTLTATNIQVHHKLRMSRNESTPGPDTPRQPSPASPAASSSKVHDFPAANDGDHYTLSTPWAITPLPSWSKTTPSGKIINFDCVPPSPPPPPAPQPPVSPLVLPHDPASPSASPATTTTLLGVPSEMPPCPDDGLDSIYFQLLREAFDEDPFLALDIQAPDFAGWLLTTNFI